MSTRNDQTVPRSRQMLGLGALLALLGVGLTIVGNLSVGIPLMFVGFVLAVGSRT